MTHKQINSITFSEAIAVLKSHGKPVKLTFDTKESAVKAEARKVLRTEKLKKHLK